MSTKTIPWTKLFLEAFAIFLGVSAGFFAENYRQHLDERRQEKQALAQILRDLAVDEDDMRPIVDRSGSIAQAMLWLHNNLNRTDVSADSIIRRISEVPAVYTYESASAAYAGLKASGSLDLIESPDLLADIHLYFEDRQAAMEELNEYVLEGESRFWVRVAPYVRFAPASTLYDRPPIEYLDLAGFRSDRTVRAEIVWNGGVNEVQARDGRIFMEMNTNLTQDVQDYLASLN